MSISYQYRIGFFEMDVRLRHGFYWHLLFLFLGFVHPAKAYDVTVGIFDFPPFYSLNGAGAAEGLLIEQATGQLKEVGLKPHFVQYRVPDLIEAIKNGEVTAAMLVKHPQLFDQAYYSEAPVVTMRLMAYKRKGTEDLSHYADLAGKRVLVLAGYGYGGMLDILKQLPDRPDFVEVSDISSGIDLLIAGRGDYFLSYLKPSLEIALRRGYQIEDGFILADEIQKLNVYWVISRHFEDASGLLEKLKP